jgi:hypothetical protein
MNAHPNGTTGESTLVTSFHISSQHIGSAIVNDFGDPPPRQAIDHELELGAIRFDRNVGCSLREDLRSNQVANFRYAYDGYEMRELSPVQVEGT